MTSESVFKALVRRKKIIADSVDTSQLKRCLSFFDLTCLGIGSTLGLGVYVLAGQVASGDTGDAASGPSVCISFLIAAIASVFAGLCYAEFGSRVPRAGSAYIYSYVTVGEFMAFVIGWNLILEYVIGTASVANGYSIYIDSLFDGKISKYFKSHVAMHISGLGDYPDPIAFLLTLGLAVLLALGVKESIRLHTIMTVLNLLVVAFVIIAGLFKIDSHNWNISKDEIPPKYTHAGNGGFFPNGFSGVMVGAATCFYAFVGFDAIATTGEEAKNPKRNIPLSIVLSLLFIFLAYFGISAIQTLLYPYYLQGKDDTNGAALPYIFEHLGWTWARWIVSIGALNGLSTSLLGAMYPLPRVLYSMANDGIILRFLAIVHPRFKTPVYATIISGGLAAVMAALFDINQLINMMSIGTLLAYTLVAESIIIIRYADDLKEINHVKDEISEDNISADDKSFAPQYFTKKDIFRQILNLDQLSRPTRFSSLVSNSLIAAISLLLIILDAQLVFFEPQIFDGNVGPIVSSCITVVIIVFVIYCLTRQPMIPKSVSFEVPGVPVIPFLSVFVNIYLMFKLSYDTWIRFGVWMVIGLLMYFLYGIRNSSERLNRSDSESRVVNKC